MKPRYSRGAGILLVAIGAGLIAAGCERVESRVSQRVATAASERVASAFARDEARDAASRIVRLAEPRRVFRYVSSAEAKIEARQGFRARSHFTSRAKPGRPLSAATAADRYGLGPGRTRRFTVKLPEGTPVRLNKVIGGAAGTGEVRIEQHLPATAIERVVSLPTGR